MDVIQLNQATSSFLAPLLNSLMQQTPVKCFFFVRIKESGHWEFMISHDILLRNFIHLNLLSAIPESIELGYRKPGNYLVNVDARAFQAEKKLLQAYYNQNLDHKFTMIRCKQTNAGKVVEYFSFAGQRENYDINYFYINHSDTLTQFNDRFINALILNQMTLPGASLPSHQWASHQGFFRNFFDNRPTLYDTKLVLPNVKQLTNREYEIVRLLIDGKTSKETATILNLSIRTVENHFQNLRKKFHCKSKTQILQKLSQFDPATPELMKTKEPV